MTEQGSTVLEQGNSNKFTNDGADSGYAATDLQPRTRCSGSTDRHPAVIVCRYHYTIGARAFETVGTYELVWTVILPATVAGVVAPTLKKTIHVDKITEALTEPLRKCLKVRHLLT